MSTVSFPVPVPALTAHALAPNTVSRVLQSPFPRHSLLRAPKRLLCPSAFAPAHLPRGQALWFTLLRTEADTQQWAQAYVLSVRFLTGISLVCKDRAQATGANKDSFLKC